MKPQDLSFKMNTKRNGKSYNDGRKSVGDRFERKLNALFKVKRFKLSVLDYQ